MTKRSSPREKKGTSGLEAYLMGFRHRDRFCVLIGKLYDPPYKFSNGKCSFCYMGAHGRVLQVRVF
jgi:hypothetical protein